MPVGTNANVMTIVADAGNITGGLGDCTVCYVPDTYRGSARIILETREHGYTVEFISLPEAVSQYMDGVLGFVRPEIDEAGIYSYWQEAGGHVKGIEAAKQNGKKLGRPALTFPANWNEVYASWKAGEITAKTAMEQTGTKRTSFYKLVGMTENQ